MWGRAFPLRATRLSTAAAKLINPHWPRTPSFSSAMIPFEWVPDDEFQALDQAVRQAEASHTPPKSTLQSTHAPHPHSSRIPPSQPSNLPSDQNQSSPLTAHVSNLPTQSSSCKCVSSPEGSPRSPLSSPITCRPPKSCHISSPSACLSPSSPPPSPPRDLSARLATPPGMGKSWPSVGLPAATHSGHNSTSEETGTEAMDISALFPPPDVDIEDLVHVTGHVTRQLKTEGVGEVAYLSAVETVAHVDESGPASWHAQGAASQVWGSQNSVVSSVMGFATGGSRERAGAGQLLMRAGFSSGARSGTGSRGIDRLGVDDKAAQGSPLKSHRKRRGLSVTDVSSSEWCELQVDFGLREGKPEPTETMKAGTERHAELEMETLQEFELVQVQVATREDHWAVRFLNMLSGLRQLKLSGMTRELYVVGEVAGVWMVGIIDELRMPWFVEAEVEGGGGASQGGARPLILDTKTRLRPTPPSEPQKLTSRLQLMCYKMLFDGLTTGATFKRASFHKHFGLKGSTALSPDIVALALESGLSQASSLSDLLRALLAEWQTFDSSDQHLLIRYEWQEDRSLLGRDEFMFEHEWAHARVAWHLQYWKGLREPEPVPNEELWKCRFCAFSTSCPSAQGSKAPKPSSPSKRLSQ